MSLNRNVQTLIEVPTSEIDEKILDKIRANDRKIAERGRIASNQLDAIQRKGMESLGSKLLK